MDMLIKHGTWMIVPGGLALALIYNHVYAKVFPHLIARSLTEEDRRRERPRLVLREVRFKKQPARKATVL